MVLSGLKNKDFSRKILAIYPPSAMRPKIFLRAGSIFYPFAIDKGTAAVRELWLLFTLLS